MRVKAATVDESRVGEEEEEEDRERKANPLELSVCRAVRFRVRVLTLTLTIVSLRVTHRKKNPIQNIQYTAARCCVLLYTQAQCGLLSRI